MNRRTAAFAAIALASLLGVAGCARPDQIAAVAPSPVVAFATPAATDAAAPGPAPAATPRPARFEVDDTLPVRVEPAGSSHR